MQISVWWWAWRRWGPVTVWLVYGLPLATFQVQWWPMAISSGHVAGCWVAGGWMSGGEKTVRTSYHRRVIKRTMLDSEWMNRSVIREKYCRSKWKTAVQSTELSLFGAGSWRIIPPSWERKEAGSDGSHGSAKHQNIDQFEKISPSIGGEIVGLHQKAMEVCQLDKSTARNPAE